MEKLLDKIAENLTKPANKHLVGVMATDAIRTRLVKGDGFAPLSGATREFRGSSAKPLQDTGSLRDSFNYRVEDNTVVVHSSCPYAAVHNEGKTIRAKKSWLYIPASAFTRQLMRRYGPSPKHVLSGLRSDGYSVFRAGRAIGFKDNREKTKGEDKKTTWIYWLKKEVVIPARRFFYLDDADLRTILNEVEVLP